MTDDEVRTYLQGLRDGEQVIETSMSGMHGRTGVVYHNAQGCVCVLWDNKNGDGSSQMGTSATWGTRRLSNVP